MKPKLQVFNNSFKRIHDDHQDSKGQILKKSRVQDDRNKYDNRNLQYYDRRLCLKGVPKDMTKPQIMKLVEDFEDITIYMPTNTHHKGGKATKLVFLDFPKPWYEKHIFVKRRKDI